MIKLLLIKAIITHEYVERLLMAWKEASKQRVCWWISPAHPCCSTRSRRQADGYFLSTTRVSLDGLCATATVWSCITPSGQTRSVNRRARPTTTFCFFPSINILIDTGKYSTPSCIVQQIESSSQAKVQYMLFTHCTFLPCLPVIFGYATVVYCMQDCVLYKT